VKCISILIVIIANRSLCGGGRYTSNRAVHSADGNKGNCPPPPAAEKISLIL
jgi:hypothetical protein